MVVGGVRIGTLIPSCPMQNPSSLAPYNILMKYLDLVLFDKKFSSIYGEGGQEAADTILQLYADLRPQQLPKVFLKSWIDQHYSLGMQDYYYREQNQQHFHCFLREGIASDFFFS